MLKKIEKIKIIDGIARSKTASGKEAVIFQNDRNIKKPYFQLIIEGKIVFNRGSMSTVIEKLNSL